MKMVKSLLVAAALVALSAAVPAAAQTPGQSLLWSSRQGDLKFPFTPPTASQAGTIDNMVIGSGTPKAGTFTSITGASDPFAFTGKAATSASTAGGAASVSGAAGGATSGNGGNANISGGSAAGSGNGGDVVLSGGSSGTGVAGNIVDRSLRLVHQGAQSTQDAAATLTAAQLLAGILTSNPSGAVNLQLPLATALDTALPNSAAGDAFDFSVISLAGSTNLPTLTTNTGWTLVGGMTFTSVAGNAGRFRARKTGTGAWTLYRLS